ncbi:MAG: hypothetical protein IID40_08520, partial [Planctomycetes bacterium]|nr:hypothetical protein [Planctomycetota bacterium]
MATAPMETVTDTGSTPITGTGTSRPIQLDAVLDRLNLTADERRYLACYRYRLERIIADLPDLNGRDVLDLGCNTGFMMALFRHLWPEVRLVGCDVCRPYLIASRRRGFATLMCNLQETEPP